MLKVVIKTVKTTGKKSRAIKEGIKIMKKDIKTNENKGFSLVELIVVIAIMAVMTSVLAPALLKYVEESRAQKDNSAMNEVTHAIKLALANEDVYDECLAYTFKENYSTYASTTDETAADVDTANKMRGLTVTFKPVDYVVTLSDAKINQIKATSATYEGITGVENKQAVLSALTAGGNTGVLNGELKATIGNTVNLTSKTYRNSDYTVFIKMGNLSEAIEVSGQWNGTNLEAPVGE